MATNTQELIDELVGLYSQAQEDIIKRIELKVKSGKFIGYDAALVKDINNILSELQTQSIEWSNENIPKIYNQGKKQLKSKNFLDAMTILSQATEIQQFLRAIKKVKSYTTDLNQARSKYIPKLFDKATNQMRDREIEDALQTLIQIDDLAELTRSTKFIKKTHKTIDASYDTIAEIHRREAQRQCQNTED